MADVYEDLARRIGRPLPADFENQYRSRVAAVYDAHLVPMPGVPRLLTALQHPFCVASNGPPAKMAHGLGATGLARFFEGRAFSAYEVGHWKPEPQLFLHAAERMGFAPGDCVVVEDSEAGLLAAEAAGMQAIHFRHEGMPGASRAAACIRHFRELHAVLGTIAGLP